MVIVLIIEVFSTYRFARITGEGKRKRKREKGMVTATLTVKIGNGYSNPCLLPLLDRTHKRAWSQSSSGFTGCCVKGTLKGENVLLYRFRFHLSPSPFSFPLVLRYVQIGAYGSGGVRYRG